MQLYAQLLRHRWKHLRRGGAAGPERVKRLILGFFGVYLAASLAITGFAYHRLLGTLQPGVNPADAVNGLLLSALVSLLVLRFFTQRSTSMALAPYLARPGPRRKLVRFLQVSSLSSLINVLVPAFVIPLWHQTILNGPYAALSGVGAYAWLAGVGLFVLATHYAHNALRLLLAQNVRWFAALVGTTVALLGIDSLLDTRVLLRLSLALFTGLMDGQVALLAVPAAIMAASWAASAHLLTRSLRHAAGRGRASQQSVPAMFSLQRGATRNLMLLELKLIARNRRPSTLVGISTLLIVTYVPLLLVGRSVFPFIDAVTGLFVTGILAASYGQLMFAWDSPHFDGLLARPLAVRTQVRAKLLLLQCGCVTSLLIALPFFVWLAPEVLLLSVGFMLYNLGITCPFVLFFSLWNRKGLAPRRSGFFNYEGLSVQHWIGSLPVFIPPLVLAFLFEESWVLLSMSLVGLLGMALLPTWTLYFARVFSRHRHAMALGFRRSE
jgi:hypothetical protein